MLIEFRFKNYRSFRDEATLSMEATGLGPFKKSLISYGSLNLYRALLYMEKIVEVKVM